MAILAGMAILTIMTTMGDASTCMDDLVYPYEAKCSNPARYYGEEVYELLDETESGSLAPEWNETASAYYVRLADSGATYKFDHWPTREYRAFVTVSRDVRIVNVDSGRLLGWKTVGDNSFLVELPRHQSSAFQFANYNDAVECISISPQISCEAYTILSFQTSLGLTSYVQDNITYFTLANESDAFPFRLRKIRTFASLA